MRTGPKPGLGKQVSLDGAREAWGEAAPEWIVVLAEQCDRTSQGQVARRLGCAPSTINQVLRGRYPSPPDAIEAAVRAAFFSDRLRCPALGMEIPLAACLEHQKHVKAGNRLSGFRVRMARHCPSCPNSRIGGKHEDASE